MASVISKNLFLIKEARTRLRCDVCYAKHVKCDKGKPRCGLCVQLGKPDTHNRSAKPKCTVSFPVAVQGRTLHS